MQHDVARDQRDNQLLFGEVEAQGDGRDQVSQGRDQHAFFRKVDQPEVEQPRTGRPDHPDGALPALGAVDRVGGAQDDGHLGEVVYLADRARDGSAVVAASGGQDLQQHAEQEAADGGPLHDVAFAEPGEESPVGLEPLTERGREPHARHADAVKQHGLVGVGQVAFARFAQKRLVDQPEHRRNQAIEEDEGAGQIEEAAPGVEGQSEQKHIQAGEQGEGDVGVHDLLRSYQHDGEDQRVLELNPLWDRNAHDPESSLTVTPREVRVGLGCFGSSVKIGDAPPWRVEVA